MGALTSPQKNGMKKGFTSKIKEVIHNGPLASNSPAILEAVQRERESAYQATFKNMASASQASAPLFPPNNMDPSRDPSGKATPLQKGTL